MNVMLRNTIQCNQPPFSNLPPGNFKYKLNFGGSSKSVIGFMTQLKEKKVSKAFLDDMCESKKGQLLKRKGLRQKMRHHTMQLTLCFIHITISMGDPYFSKPSTVDTNFGKSIHSPRGIVCQFPLCTMSVSRCVLEIRCFRPLRHKFGPVVHSIGCHSIEFFALQSNNIV